MERLIVMKLKPESKIQNRMNYSVIIFFYSGTSHVHNKMPSHDDSQAPWWCKDGWCLTDCGEWSGQNLPTIPYIDKHMGLI